MRSYLADSVWDVLLVFAAAFALAYTCCTGFFATKVLIAQPWVIAFGCLVVVVALFCIAYNRRTLIIGGVLFAVVLLVVLVVAARLGTSASVLVDQEGNYAFAAVLVVAPTLVVFLLSRVRWGCLVLVVLGVFVGVVMEYLYGQDHIASFVLFMLAAAVLYIYRNYQKSLLSAESDDMSFSAVSLTGIGLMALSLLAGAGLFLAVVQPLNPPNIVVKLITEHVKIQEEHVKGTGDTLSAQNDQLYSNNVSDEATNSGQISNENRAQRNAENAQNDTDRTQRNAGSSLGLDSRADQDAGSPTTLEVPSYLAALIVALVILVIVAAVLLKLWRRRKRHARMLALPNNEHVVQAFLFFMERFGKLKFPEPGSLTLREYVVAQSETFGDFESGTRGPRFAELVETYNRGVYGHTAVTDGECAEFDAYYDAFYANSRRFLGVPRYLLLFFFI